MVGYTTFKNNAQEDCVRYPNNPGYLSCTLHPGGPVQPCEFLSNFTHIFSLTLF